MFDSGISVKDLIYELKNTEIDIALDIPNATYVTWLNALQQLLYTEIIKEQKKVEINATTLQNPLNLYSIRAGNESTPRFEDIHAVYADGIQLLKTSLTNGVIFPNTFYKIDNELGYNTDFSPSKLTIVYFVRPEIIEADKEDVIDKSNVMIPIEFIDLVKAKLRGEAYKLANEDGIAAKWLNDYNVLLETFKSWCASKYPKDNFATFGM